MLLNEKAGVVDDTVITRMNDNKFKMIINAANTEKDMVHLHKLHEERFANQDVHIHRVLDKDILAL